MYDLKGQETASVTGKISDLPHFANFLETVRGQATLNSEIAVGQKSALLCHLGNIAWRSGRTIDFDPQKQQIVGHADVVQQLWSREYRPGWAPVV